MKIKTLAHFLDEEVYLIGVEDDMLDGGPLRAFGSLEELVYYMKEEVNPTTDSELHVLHGILSSADTLPGDLKGKNAFVVIEDSEIEDAGLIMSDSFENTKSLVNIIERTENKPLGVITLVNIDNIYVLYGYELKIVMTVDEDDVDEEIIDVCKEVAGEAEESRERNATD